MTAPKSAFLFVSAALMMLAACAPASRAQTTTTTPAPVTATPTPAAPAPTTPAASGFTPVKPLSDKPVREFARAAQVIDPARMYHAVIKTDKGDVTVELNAKAAPIAVNNFVFLALNHFYDGTRFHRVIDGFMAQGGDPLSADAAQKARWGTGGPGYNFSAEPGNGLKFDAAGVLGMARSASLDSQGSQFFITVAPADFLSGQYTVFGKVLKGQDVLDKLTRNDSGRGPVAGAAADELKSVEILVSSTN
ncbi:peptidylprolyl isomerase [Deinococcus arenicola]|uniref:Peptidyl-prolyl cis-trans isomerase n=1 Tax=Deinococcus arenicola TaxID=2994950 RepID=A0ABU4DTV4_9DEIO|nr:peptidylprolyl isomerase [Deinococcus sp. ZS9-10]MDV6375850.1 peptidylprolyl isomerase [Deinococcus sp. ZS9-10]